MSSNTTDITSSVKPPPLSFNSISSRTDSQGSSSNSSSNNKNGKKGGCALPSPVFSVPKKRDSMNSNSSEKRKDKQRKYSVGSRGSRKSSASSSSKGSRKKVQVEVKLRPMFKPKDTLSKIIIILLYSILIAYTILIIFGPLFLLPQKKEDWCPSSTYLEQEEEMNLLGRSSNDNSVAGGGDGDEDEREYENPDYITDPCRYKRLSQLLYLTLEECDLSRRMLSSVVFGGAIGYERRSSDRPAGIRTMGLVSLGSCFFTISSQLAFKSSTMGWDASRVTAAIPSGVGFLGAGLIWKGTVDNTHQVHGLTTAASVWLSAAIGVGAGGALYFITAYSTILVVFVLRYGPKLYLQDDTSYADEEEEEDNTLDDTEEEFSSDFPTGSEHDQPSKEGEKEKTKDYSRLGSEEDFSDSEQVALLKAWKATMEGGSCESLQKDIKTQTTQNGADDGGEGQALLQEQQQQHIADDYFYGSLSPERPSGTKTVSVEEPPATMMMPIYSKEPSSDSSVDPTKSTKPSLATTTPPHTPLVASRHSSERSKSGLLKREKSETKRRSKSPQHRKRHTRKIPSRPSFHN